ncbi:phytase [Hyphomonas sp.]|uniref:phytase n=1 Tax=Hyphomonas sp. TaxID=87 RepID=UPI00391DBE2B
MLIRSAAISALALSAAAACATPPAPDAAQLVPSPAGWASPVVAGQVFVMAVAETDPVSTLGDAADDPAFWRHPADAARSMVLGTDKRVGLYAYDLSGRNLQSLPIGQLNNVDVRQSADRAFDVATASNRSTNAVSVFLIDRASGEISHKGDVPTGMEEPYGLCQARDNGRDLAAVTYKDGTVQIFDIDITEGGVSGDLLKTIKLETQLEGCVFDEVNGNLFIGEEALGLWVVAWRDDVPLPRLIDQVGSGTGLAADVEGISLWRGAAGEGWIVVSAQAEDRYVVYERKAPHAHRGSFSVMANEALGIDGVSHTDGLDVFSGALPGFPRGLLMVQDDANPNKGENQNFKLVSWADIEAALGLPELEPET